MSSSEAWTLLRSDATARLIDVRTEPEWAFVGVPDLASIGKDVALIPWQVYPAMQHNPGFAATVAAIAPSREAPLLFLCRSGVRSRAAAEAMTAAGFRRCYNVAQGFEGRHDAEGHRGRIGGWKAEGLPWVQQ